LDSYVYEQPINHIDQPMYLTGFINSILLAIIDLSEKLIELNVYAIHPIVNNSINYYTPLDDINLYDPVENDNRPIYII